MKKNIRRFWAVLLVICSLVTLCPAGLFANASEAYIFEERFADENLDGWKYPNVGTVSKGIYTIAEGGINIASTAISESCYSVSSKVKLTKNAKNGNYTAALVIGSDAEGKVYLEFGIGIVGYSTYAYLYQVNADEVSTIYQISSSVPGTKNGKIQQKTEYKLTALVDNGVLTCYINGEQFTTYQNLGITNSYAGIKGGSANAQFDDFIIQKETEKKVASIQLIDPPSKMTVNGVGCSFDIKVQYTGSYGQKTISSDAEGVSISGFDGTTGTKKFTVSYGEASTSFVAEVVENQAPAVFFEDNFNNGLDSSKYTVTGQDASGGYAFQYMLKGASGQVTATLPKDMGMYDSYLESTARVNDSELKAVGDSNYVVEADAVLLENTPITSQKAVHARLEFTANAGQRYSFVVCMDGTVQLRKKYTVPAYAKIQGVKLGKSFHMKVELYDGMAFCYYNDECVLIYQDEGLKKENRTKVISVVAQNGAVAFDNLTVTEIPDYSKWAATKMTVDDRQTGETDISTMKAYVITPSRYILNLHYVDGSSIPVLLEQSMIRGYSSNTKASQSILLQYGPFTKTIKYDYTDYIFYDNMTDGKSSYWGGTVTDSITQSYENGLKITWQKNTATQQDSEYVDLFADYPDVRVSVDMAMDHTDNNKTRMLGISARYDGTTGNYYGFYLHYDSSKTRFYASLQRKGSSQGNDRSVELARYSANTLAALIGEEDIYFGKTYTLSMECSGNMIYLYVNDRLLDAYQDTSDEALLSGSRAGFRALHTSATVSNFRVEQASHRTIESVELSNADGMVDGKITLYQGFEISPFDYTTNVIFSDGLTCGLSLHKGLIGEYDNITPGKRSVAINCLGKIVDLDVEVVARPEYIQKFAAKVKDCKAAKKLTLKEKEYVDELKEMYNSLSGYEVGTIDEEVIGKYQEVVDALYRLEHPELAEYDTIFINDFNESFNELEWDSNAGDSQGSWRTYNSVFANEQLCYGWSSASRKISYVENTTLYGEINSVEADIIMVGGGTDECQTSILSCISQYGYYHARIIYSPNADEGKKFTMYLMKNAGGSDATLDTAYISVKGIDMELNKWYNLRLTNVDGRLNIYLDDTKIIEYDDSDSPTCMTTGGVGFRALYGDMRFDSLRVMGTAMGKTEYEPQIEPTYYTDDFEDEAEGTDPSHWIEETDSDLWKVYKKGDRLVYGTKSKEYGYTWLHTFESDPQVEMDFMVENAGSNGRIEFLTRYTQEKYSYAGIGYDFSQSKWYIYTARGMDFEPQIVYAADTYKLSAGTWNTIKIEEDSVDIKVYVNGELVIEDTNAYMTGYGRVGLLSENANLYIDNFSYTMPHGGSVSDGVIEYLFDYDTFGTMSNMQVLSLGGSKLIGIPNKAQYLSDDMGLTWRADTTGQYKAVKGEGSYPNILEISEGEYLMLYETDYSLYRSSDYMKTWKKVGQITADLGEDELTACHINCLEKLTLKDGTVRVFLPITRYRGTVGNTNGYYTRIFYSDDYGTTWQESVNDTRDIVPNYVDGTSGTFMWGESKMTIDAEGVIRLYNSRQYGCIVYTESHDGGVTWEGFYTLPYLQNGTSSHSIAEDPQNPGTFYMVCVNDKTKLINDVLPRTRYTLVRSTDGVNWEYVMDIERFTGYGDYRSKNLYQMIDPSISIIDGYMIITVARSYAYELFGAHNKLAMRLVRIEMDKLPESGEWNDATIADPTRPETIEIDTMPQTIFGEKDIFAISGGKLKVTAFNGNVTYLDLNKLEMVSDEPNMYKKGTYEISLMNRYGQMVSFEVEVTDNYNIEWNIEGKGEVTPYFEKIAKGLARTFTAEPEEDWKVKEVLVNGTAIEVKDNQFTVVGSEDIKIDVIFEKDASTMFRWIVPVICIVLLGGIVILGVVKRKQITAIVGKWTKKNKTEE